MKSHPSADGAALDAASDWLLRLNGAPGDAAQRAAFDRWLAESERHRAAFRSVDRMWRLSGELAAEDAPGETAALRSSRRPARYALWGAAGTLAACLLLALLPAAGLWLRADHATGVGEMRRVVLQDGSVAHLDSDSALAIDYSPAVRRVRLLSGQAFFTVVADAGRPFVVAVRDVTTTVTGTAFEVRADADRVFVAVQSGAVRVALDRGGRRAEAALSPGERIVVGPSGELAKAAVVRDDVGSWRSGRLTVDGATVAEVLGEMDRHYRGIIVVRDDAFSRRQVTGVFDLGDPVEAVRAVARTQAGTVREITPFLLVVAPR